MTPDRPPTAGRLVAVVVTHDRLHQLQVTLPRLLAAGPELLHAVLVVDNASTDGTAAWLAAQDDPRLAVHRSDTNQGGAGGFEAGLKAAVARFDPDWMVVMDDDARPEPGAFAAFHAAPRAPDTAYGAAVRFPSGGICEMNRPGLNPFRRPAAFWRAATGQGRAGYHLTDAAYASDALAPIDMGSFVGLFLPREAIARCGYPDGGLFLYGDDVIYSLGMRAAGLDILFDPALRFEHDCSTFGAVMPGADGQVGDAAATRPAGKRVFTPLWKVYYTYRNGLIMYRRAAGPLFWPLLPVLALKWRLAARRYGPQAPDYLRLMRRAISDGVARRTGLDHAEVRALAAPR